MKVHCPIPGCSWKHDIVVDGNKEEDIYAEARSLIRHHRRTTKSCMKHICSCSQPFQSQNAIDRHLYHNPIVPGGLEDHFELSYASIITQDNHKILNIDTMNADQEIRNFSAFGIVDEIVYGSNIGRNKTTFNVPLHARAEFTRAGTAVAQVNDKRPKKKPKQFTGMSVDDSSSSSEEEMYDCVAESTSIEPIKTSTNNSLSHAKRMSQSFNNSRLLSANSREPKLNTNICLPTQSSSGRTNVSKLKSSIRFESPLDVPDHEPACRRSERILQRAAKQTDTLRSQPSMNLNHDHYEEDEEMVVASEPNNQSQFFTVHEERAANDLPELNTNGVNGYDLEEVGDVHIGWGGDDNDDEDPDGFLYEDPFARNGNVEPELEEALQNLTMTDEVFGNSSALPEYNNHVLPVRTPEEMASVNHNIRRYVRLIKDHRRRVSLTPLDHMKYLEILVEMNQSNAPASLFDKVAKLIFSNFEQSDQDAAPTKETLLSWIEKKVHPPELIHLSKAQKTVLSDCPSGRSVSITHFDYDYQMALLLSNEEIMKPENLLFPNLDDPFELTPVDGPLEDVNSGFFHHKMTRFLCKWKNDLLFPFVDFCDGTNVSRNSLEPYLRCFGIFNRKTRNKPESWFALGFFEPLVNFSPLNPNQKYDSVDKLNDYHHVLKFLMKDCVKLEETGFIFDLDLGNNRKFEVVFRPVTQLVLGDCKGADALCGRFGSHRKTKGVCRDCDCPTSEASSSIWQCNFLDRTTMKNKTAEELKLISFWKLTHNAFDFVNQHVPDVWGVFGITPPEILHLFYIGLCVYLCQGFIFQRSGAMRKYLDASAISLYTNNKRQSLRGMPHLAAYRNGFVTDVAMTTGKEKFSKVFLLYLFLMKTDIARNLVTQKPKRDEPPTTRRHIKEWIYLLESSLALSSFMKLESIDRNDLLQRIRVLEDEVNVVEDSFFQRQIRRYMKLYKRLVKREKGQGLDLVKFHQLLHIFKYILHHGSPANSDGSRPEAVGKFLIKNPGKRTQIRLSILTLHTAIKMVEQRNIQDFAKMVLRRDDMRFHSKKLYKFFMFPQEIEDDNIEDDEDSLHDDDSDSDEEIIVHHSRIDNPNLQKRKHYHLSGSIYELYIHRHGNDMEMKIDWKTKVKYTNLWSKNFLLGLERRLFTDLGHGGGTIRLSKSIIGRTSLKVHIPGEEPIRYTAHPSFRSGLPWFDWVVLDWGALGFIPARLLMILETTDLCENDIIYNNRDEGLADDPQNESLNETSLLKPRKIYLVVRSARQAIEPPSDLNFKFYSRLSSHITLEESFCIVSVTCLVGPAYVIANIPYGDAEADTESIRNFIMVKDFKEWSKYFINKEDTEVYGQPLQHNNDDEIEE